MKSCGGKPFYYNRRLYLIALLTLKFAVASSYLVRAFLGQIEFCTETIKLLEPLTLALKGVIEKVDNNRRQTS